VGPLIEPGRVNSLSQALIKLTAPGVPDVYQGNELWDLSLVDPDNRRPVDYALRRGALSEPAHGPAPQTDLPPSRQRAAHPWGRPGLFGRAGGYAPIDAEGTNADHVVAFGRGDGCVTVSPRLPLKLGGHWGDTTVELPDGEWSNELTGETVGGGRVKVGNLLE